jgi:predicted polyphosphate/ATP-dependent NAD kinase
VTEVNEELRIGLIVNPVAGMGGRVGLKGTDGADMLAEALRRGAEPVAPVATMRFLERLGDDATRLTWLTCSGDMGADILVEVGLVKGTHFHVAYDVPSLESTDAKDTRDACKALIGGGAELIIFCGGDGTARDVMDIAGTSCPVLGVPAGVKMFSGVFALSPEAAAEVLHAHMEGRSEEGEGEVADVDEVAYRAGRLAVRLHGVVRILRVPTLIQSMKSVIHVPDEGTMQRAIARYVVELVQAAGKTPIILGAGSTVGAVAEVMGIPKTPLGVDVVKDGHVVAEDASEEDLLRVLSGEDRALIVISPIGAQGFLLGRGNQQISPDVLDAAGGPGALTIVATPHKVQGLECLLVDTGDRETDIGLEGMRRVIVGFHDVSMIRVEAASAPGE